jgi:hypothetical protein
MPFDVRFKDLKNKSYFRIPTSNVVWRKVNDDKSVLGEDDSWGERTAFSPDTWVMEVSAFESFWQDLKDRNIIPPNEGSDAKHYCELGFNVHAEKENKARARHDELMLTDPEYRERFMLISATEGKRLTVVMEVVDRYANVELQASLFNDPSRSGEQELVAGCRVIAINYLDINAKFAEMRDKLHILTDQICEIVGTSKQ